MDKWLEYLDKDHEDNCYFEISGEAAGELAAEIRKLIDQIGELENEIEEWKKVGNIATQAACDTIDDLKRATDYAEKKHKEVEEFRKICDKQKKTMNEMWSQIQELAELAGVVVERTKQ